MKALRRILAVARIEVLRLLRARVAFTMLLAVPAAQVLLFGYAIQPNAASVSVAVAAASQADAKLVADAMAKQPALRVVAPTLKPGGAEAMVRSGKALIGIEVPPQRSAFDAASAAQPVRVIVDATNAPLTEAAAPRISAAYWRAVAEQTGLAGAAPGLSIERLYNATARPDWTFLPSLIGVAVMIAMIMLATLSLAREREGGTWEALLVLPVAPLEALIGKLTPYVLVGTAQGILVLGAGIALFDLPTRGAVGALIALLPLYSAAHLVLGYAISARAATQLSALQGALAFYLPVMLLSGFLYPFETLPRWAQLVGEVFPLTHLIRAARGALLRGDDTATVLMHGLPMLGFLLGALLLALLVQARRLD